MLSTMRIAVFVACVATAVQAQLFERERDCSQIPCGANIGDNFTLSCGNSGEEITKILFASYGNPSGECPVKTSKLAASDLGNLSTSDTCNLAASKALIEAACLGEVECTVDVADLVGTDVVGLDTCSAPLVYTVAVECADPFNLFGILALLIIAFIGLALGATITVDIVRETVKLHKRAVLIGWACQFGLMPLVAYVYCVAFSIQPLVAFGVLLCGTVPGGTTSNLMCYYAKGNVALSILMSVASTLCALFMLPLTLFLYGTLALGLTGDFGIPFPEIIGSLFVVIIPVSIGIYTREKSEKIAKYFEIGGSVIGLLFLLAALIVGVLDNPDLFDPSQFQKSWIGAALFQPIGAALGFAASRLFELSGPELRAVVLETGVQNYTIAIAVAGVSFTGCTRSVVLTFILVASFWYILNSFWLTLVLRWSSRFDTAEEEKEALESAKLAVSNL